MSTGRAIIVAVLALTAAVLAAVLLVSHFRVESHADTVVDAALRAVADRSEEGLANAVRQFPHVADIPALLEQRVAESVASRGPLCRVLAEAGHQGNPVDLLSVGDALLEYRRELSSLELASLVVFFGYQPLDRSLKRLESVWTDEQCDSTSRMQAIRAVGVTGAAALDSSQLAAALAALQRALTIADCEMRMTALVSMARLTGPRDPGYASSFKQVLEECPHFAEDHRAAYLREFYPPE